MLLMVFSQKVSAQVRADPSIMYKSEGNFLHISVVGRLIDHKVELDGVYPRDGHFIGTIKGFGFSELEFSRFYCGRHQRRNRQAGVGRYDGYRWLDG